MALMNPKSYGPSSISSPPRRTVAKTIISEAPHVSRDKAVKVMHNERLAARSETFQDDDGVVIEKRCFFLLGGDDDINTNAVSLSLTHNVFDEPRHTQRLDVQIKISTALVEICSELILSMSSLLPEFKSLFRYDDLYPCRSNLHRYIELKTPLYMIKQQIIHADIPEAYIKS